MNYLAIQNTYDEVQLAVMNGTSVVVASTIPKFDASKKIIATVDELLTSVRLSLSDLSFIVANCGPGPFTTLRVVVTTINGLSYATHIPLIGINALEAAAQEWRDENVETTAILFNAFGNDVYTLVKQNNTTLLYGVYSITSLLETLQNSAGTIRFLGNGSALHKELILQTLGAKASIPENIPLYPSLETVARMGHEKWEKEKSDTYSLEPVYLKQHPAAR